MLITLSRIEMKAPFPDFFQGHQIVHTAVNAGNHRQFLLLQKCLYHTHSLADQQISLNICLEKEKILRRVKHGIFVIKAQVLRISLAWRSSPAITRRIGVLPESPWIRCAFWDSRQPVICTMPFFFSRLFSNSAILPSLSGLGK